MLTFSVVQPARKRVSIVGNEAFSKVRRKVESIGKLTDLPADNGLELYFKPLFLKLALHLRSRLHTVSSR